uniref:Mannose-binding protein n=1 Tax=Portunus pelagicus TaxID=80836 RepID=A2I7J1_PORPE|nr:mannose-binding protein [Portunus pelagicus]
MGLTVCLAQFGGQNFFSNQQFRFGRPPSRSRGRNSFRSFSRPQSQRSRGGTGAVHHSDNEYDYHYSWLNNERSLDGGDAVNSYCRSQGDGWTGVSIESSRKNSFIQGLIGGNVPYIWTGAKKRGNNFVWSNGNLVGATFSSWSHTGGEGRPQPDNRDPPENCLAVLGRQVYHDGIFWHDVKCTHKKPTVCERRKF